MKSKRTQVAAINPFKKSRKKTRLPGPFPQTRVTLVAPGFPLPFLKMSTPNLFATITAKGRAPSKYPARIAAITSMRSIGAKGLV
jgi:hypothetical protein